MTTIKRCTSPEQTGWLALRMALWPEEPAEHLPEMEDCCAQPERYAQFVAYSDLGEPQGLVDIALRNVNGTDSSTVSTRQIAWSASENCFQKRFKRQKTCD